MRIDLDHQVETVSTQIPRGTSAKRTQRIPSTKLLSISNEEGGFFRARLVSGTLRTLDTAKLRAEITGLHARGNPPAVMMSMRGMDSLASGCLGAFAELSADLERVGGVLVLYNLPKEIAKIMKKTRLDRVILTAKSRPQAIKRILAAKKKHAESTRMNAA